MMESCFEKLERREQVEIDDLRKDLSSQFGALPDSEEPKLVEREHLRVYLRVRPFTGSENDSGESQDCVTIEVPDTVLLKPPSSSARLSDKSLPQTGQRFQFSRVYGPETSQRELFDGTVKGLVKDVLEGGNSLVFTYGVTNAGKTFTFLGPDADVGVLPRSLNLIFGSIEERVYTQNSIKPQRCREFIRLTKEQQAEESVCKRNLFRQLKESDKNSASQLCSTRTTLEGSSLLGVSVVTEDLVSLDVDAHTKFSVWVSFCEIYNENIHDLLEPLPSGAPRRTALRLSQDVKGNSFVKDLRWVQVTSAEEAYRVMKLGKRNQSFSSTKLNHLSSRSHSIFSIRIMRIEDIGIPRVHTISELSLCDLAGSERCAKTQNKGERLKEAGNINTSLLILGKCLNALRHNQQAKLLQHVPFRESKLTHFLQGYFCGRGRACMLVNINQCASMFDETLNVLKFSAVAQKVVVLTARAVLPNVAQRAAREVSFIINNADRKVLQRRRSSLIGWDSSLEDVQEDDDDDDCDEEDSLIEDTMQESVDEEDDDKDEVVLGKEFYQSQVALVNDLQVQLKKEQAENMVLEARIREEVSMEFSELFSEMQNDYNDRLAREKEILEERAEKRIEILKNLFTKMTGSSPVDPTLDKSVDLGDMIGAMSRDLAGIKQAAQAAHTCLGDEIHGDQAQQLEELEKTRKTLESQVAKLSELMVICQEKDEMISKLQTTMDHHVEDSTKNKEMLDAIREEIVRLKTSCTCSAVGAAETLPTSSRLDARKRKPDPQPHLEGPPPKRVLTSEACEGSTMEVERLERQVVDLQRQVELAAPRDDVEAALRTQVQELSISLGEARSAQEEERRGREEAMAALREEKGARGEALAALEYQTAGKEEALSCLEEERRAREEAVASLGELQRSHRDAMAALETKEEALAEERRALEREVAELREANGGLVSRLESARAETTVQTARADKVSDHLQAARAQLEKQLSELREQTPQLHFLAEEAKRLQLDGERLQQEAEQHEEAEAARQVQQAAMREETTRLWEALTALQQEEVEGQALVEQGQALVIQLQRELVCSRNDLAAEAGRADRLVAELREAEELLRQQEVTSRQQLQELTQQLAEQVACRRHAELGERATLDLQQSNSDLQAEVTTLRERLSLARSCDVEIQGKLAEKEALVASLQEKLAEKEVLVSSLQEKLTEKEALEEKLADKEALVASLQEKLTEKEALEEKLADKEALVASLQEKLTEKEVLQEKLTEKEALVSSLQEKLTEKEALEEKLADKEALVASLQETLTEKDVLEEKLAEKEALVSSLQEKLTEKEALEEKLADKEVLVASLQETLTEKDVLEEKLADKEALVASLQEKLREAQEKRQEEESQAARETRRREAERRRELLAMAEEAITLKDQQLKERAQEIHRLEESARLDSDKVKAVTLELQRKEDDTSDLREKLADAKKQIQQVQKEISAMREQGRVANQKLADAEKSRRQLQADLACRDRTIQQQLRKEQNLDGKSEQTQLYQKVCKDSEAKDSIMDGMRLALAEQEETQEQMELALQEKTDRIQELVGEVEKLKGLLQGRDAGAATPPRSHSQSDDLKLAKQEAAKVQEILKLSTEKHQADRRKWLEEKASLIGQAKEAENKRNQEVRKFADERERHGKQQSQLVEKEQTLQRWKQERDALVSALEVQLKKLLSSSAEKDQVISQMRCTAAQPPLESAALAELQTALSGRDAQILCLKEQLAASTHKGTEARHQKTIQTQTELIPAGVGEKPQVSTSNRKSTGQRNPRASVSSQGSSGGCPSVLESSEISTERGRTRRFPKPELEISFSPLRPDRMALRRQGQEGSVTVKITRSGRKRKSTDMEKSVTFGRRKRRPTEDEVEAENRRNTKARLTAKMTPQKDEGSANSVRSRKEGTLQKIGEFLQSSPTLLGTKAKKMMGLVSGRGEENPSPSSSSSTSSSLGLHAKKSKRKLYRPEISSPMEMPSHPIISREPELKESDHLIIKRRLRSRIAK